MTITTDAPVATAVLTQERLDLLEALGTHRSFLRQTVAGLTDEQAGLRPTASELCLGGLIKHVAAIESQWVDFILTGPAVMELSEETYAEWAEHFTFGPSDTLAGLLERYEAVAARTDELVATLPDLDATQPLPEAPWFPAGAVRSARRVFQHIIAETAQHAGHADILRETLDGQKTMG